MTFPERAKFAIPVALVVGIGMRFLVLKVLGDMPAIAVSMACGAAAAAAVVVFLRHNRQER